jgi:hypothetical protein
MLPGAMTARFSNSNGEMVRDFSRRRRKILLFCGFKKSQHKGVMFFEIRGNAARLWGVHPIHFSTATDYSFGRNAHSTQ